MNRRKEDDSHYGIVSFFEKNNVTYSGDALYWMLKEKIVDDTITVLYKHPDYNEWREVIKFESDNFPFSNHQCILQYLQEHNPISCIVAFSYTATNLDRASIRIDYSPERGDTYISEFLTIECNGKTYKATTGDYARGAKGLGAWTHIRGIVSLDVADTDSFKTYVDIPVEVENLSDAFKMTFRLPNSKGETTDFTYVITSENTN